MFHSARHLFQMLLLLNTVLVIVSYSAANRMCPTSTLASSSGEHPQVAAPRQLEAGRIERGLQLTYTIANELMDGSGSVLRIRATLTNVGSVPRHLMDYRIEERDRKGAGLLEVSSRFATDPQEDICGMGQAFETWHYTPLRLILKAGESHTEEWIVSSKGLKTAQMDGRARDGEICLNAATTYKLRLTVIPQDLDDGQRVAGSREMYYPSFSIPGPVFLLQLNQLPKAPK